jgi:hypothetical protein
MDPQQLVAHIEAVFPVEGDRWRVFLVSAAAEGGAVAGVLRLARFSDDGGLQDLLEQRVVLVPAAILENTEWDLESIVKAIDAWATQLRKIERAKMTHMMPRQLAPMW